MCAEIDPNSIIVERLTEYSEADAAALGRLATGLSERADGLPLTENFIRTVIDSPDREQIVARFNGEIVGTATMNIVMGIVIGRLGYLEDVVVDPDMRGNGIADRIIIEVKNWAREQGIATEFTSKPKREAAISLYMKQGAIKIDTNHFRFPKE